MPPLFDTQRFRAALTTRSIGHGFHYREQVGSTMDEAATLAREDAPDGTLVFAEEQTSGRGRRGRAFHSPPGENIYFTLVLHLPAADLAKASVAVPLAACDACRAAGADAAIKWPNDIWVGERKVCGMLLDSSLSAGDVTLLAGIGINVNGDPRQNPELADIATSLRLATGAHVDRETLLANLCNNLEANLDTPWVDLLPRYRERSLVLGRTVTVTETNAAPYEATAVDLSSEASLVVELPGGERHTVNAADVSVRPA